MPQLPNPPLERLNFIVFTITAMFGIAGGPWWSVLGSTILIVAFSWPRWEPFWGSAKAARSATRSPSLRR